MKVPKGILEKIQMLAMPSTLKVRAVVFGYHYPTKQNQADA